ncbi:GGDEF domain-containing protein [Pacificimonas sp. WHA3]|uniref:diguanylate cyclase n=1 Tax=Pacificimonas pallii TaxID=2827236 RepID=A0ABS6SCD9_9SPHN|nr:GGDEF domain-containing protein [Pacificimonas pallii]MBV7256079.1 GGDEF domain-containing protein [Pacificimonas pallii]
MVRQVHLLDRIKTYMDAGGIEPTPAAYEFWWAYATRADPALTEAVDAVMRTMGRVSARAMENIRREIYGAVVDPDIHELLAKTQAQLKQMGRYVEGAEEGAKDYGRALSAGRDGMNGAGGPDKKAELLAEMINATSAMIEKTGALEKQLADSTGQISMLKKDLHVAKSESRTDALTGLNNRKAFNAYLTAQSKLAVNERKPLTMAFCDIDHFKAFNDNWGHRMGDEVLRLVGKSLMKLCHGVGYPARYGGEEFVIAMPDHDLVAAANHCEKIREFIATRDLRAKGTGKDIGQITISLGVAQFRAEETPEDLIERADAALYLAKKTGRNRICLETQLEEEDDTSDLRPNGKKTAASTSRYGDMAA